MAFMSIFYVEKIIFDAIHMKLIDSVHFVY